MSHTTWECKLWEINAEFTMCYNLRANVYKMMYFWYKTSVKLSKMCKGISNHVESVKRKRGTFIMHGGPLGGGGRQFGCKSIQWCKIYCKLMLQWN